MNMERKEKLKDALREQLLALAALSALALESALCAFTMLWGKRMLPLWLEKLYMAAGGVLALGCLTVYFCLRHQAQQSGLQKIRCNGLAVLKEELWILVAFYLWMALDGAWDLVCRSLFPDAGIWKIAVSLALVCISLFVEAVFFDKLTRTYVLRKPVRSGRRPARIFKTFGVLAAALALGGVWLALRSMASNIGQSSMIGMLALHIFDAFCGYGVLAAALHLLCRGKGEEAEEGGTALPPADRGGIRPALLKAGLPFVLATVLGFLMSGSERDSLEDRIREAIETPLREGYQALAQGNMEQAVAAFELSAARSHAFESIAGEHSGYSLGEIYKGYQNDAVIGMLYLSERDSLRQIESGIRGRILGAEWYPALIGYYSELEELSEEQELFRDEVLLKLAAAGCYREQKPLSAGEVEDARMAVASLLNDYQEELAACSMFRLALDCGIQGGYTKELAGEALDLAEANRDNMLLQYLAIQIGCGYREDEASHYGRTLEAIQRFDRMFDDGTRTGEELAMEKGSLGAAAANCYQYEAALGYYEAAYELSGESQVALGCAGVYEKLGNYEACSEMAGNCLRQDPDNVQALYLAALSALKMRDTETLLEMAGRLGDLAAGLEENQEAESFLYVFAQYLSMNDSSRWTDFQYEIYDKLTEEQIEGIKSHALLWDYMTAIYQCFSRRDYEEAAAAVERILSLREDLPMGWYLKGTIAFSAKDFGTALEAFQKAERYGCGIPALYFSMANTYDAMEDYGNALIYSQKVEDSLPYQDHGQDIYGISYHNKNLLNALKRKKGE